VQQWLNLLPVSLALWLCLKFPVKPKAVRLLFNIPATKHLVTAEQPFQSLISQLCFLNFEVPFILTPGIFQATLLFGGNSINVH